MSDEIYRRRRVSVIGRKPHNSIDYGRFVQHDCNMANKSRTALRQKGYCLAPMTTVSLRVPTDLWERVGWSAAGKGVNVSDWVRDTLANASHGAKPPIPSVLGVSGSAEELAAWQKSAERRGHTAGELARLALNHIASQDSKASA